MLNKGAIVETPNHLEGEFIINLFLVAKKMGGVGVGGGGWGPTSNKLENQFIPCNYFKMEGLHCLRNILKIYMCKLDLKDAHFSVPLNPASRKFVRFLCSGKPYEFLCLCYVG